jgi:type III restriction enzyme
LFQITQKIVDDLVSPTSGHDDKKSRVMRLQSRHQMFPQVFSFVEAFVAKRVNLNAVDARELGLEKYTTLVVERVRDAIYPDAAGGEAPLLPILNRYRPISKTGSVDFPTTRPVSPTKKSHINLVVQHSDWEGKAGKLLDECAAVKCYARNDHLGLAVAYDFMGTEHSYEPDFIVRLANDLQLLLEIKGYEGHNPEMNNAKHGAAKRWVEAENNLKDFGRWDFAVCRELEGLEATLQKLQRDAATTTPF